MVIPDVRYYICVEAKGVEDSGSRVVTGMEKVQHGTMDHGPSGHIHELTLFGKRASTSRFVQLPEFFCDWQNCLRILEIEVDDYSDRIGDLPRVRYSIFSYHQ